MAAFSELMCKYIVGLKTFLQERLSEFDFFSNLLINSERVLTGIIFQNYLKSLSLVTNNEVTA